MAIQNRDKFPAGSQSRCVDTAEGSREFDRLIDRSLTFREKLEWLEEAETLTLQLRASREQAQTRKSPAR